MDGLIVKNVSKSFGKVKALDNVNFSAEYGEVHALLGENGAGKSTLIKILSGFQSADEGEIQLNGKQLLLKNPQEAINHRIGTVYQELSLIPDLTVAQNLFFENWQNKKNVLINRNALRLRAKKVIEEYRLDEIDPDALVRDLALSQQQMIEIVKVILREPQIIILDEATSALTSDKVQWLLDLARDYAKTGKIVIFISHRMQELKDSCDRITIFRNGKDVGVRTIKDMDEDEIISMMLGRKLSAYFPEKLPYYQDMTMLEVKNYNIDNLLNHASFRMRKGEVLGVGGLAGQGQIPLFLSLSGVYNAEGTLLLEEKEIKVKCPKDGIDQGIALIPENRTTEGLVQMLSVRENISLPILTRISKYGLINKKVENANANNAIDKLSIKTKDTDEIVSNLSGGNQQKVLLSKYLVNNPRIFLMLDPTRGVDVGTKVEIFKLVRDIAKKGNSVLFYSTDIDELVNVCDRVMVMCDNKIGDILEGKRITKENILKLSVGKSSSI